MEENVNPYDSASDESPLSTDAPRRGLSVWDASSIVVGTIIGAAIFVLPPLVAMQVTSLFWFVLAWVAGGAIAFCGAVCFAELTTAYNQDGGDYIYLRHAFGRYVAFLFAWTAGWIIRPANIAAMAVTFAMFAQQAIPALQRPDSPTQSQWITIAMAMLAVVLLAGLNLRGIQFGRVTQNVLTTSKVLGLLLLVLIGFSWTSNSRPESSAEINVAVQESVAEDLESQEAANQSPIAEAEESAAPPSQSVSGFLMALVFVLYTFGGWNDVSFVAAEVKDPKRNLPRALLLGLGIVTLVYLLVNAALISNLGLNGLQTTDNAPAAVVSGQMNAWGFGDRVTMLLGLLVSVSCLGAVNAMLITSPRIYYAAGRDHRWLAWFAQWDHQTETPTRALVAQTVATLLMLAICAGLNSSVMEQLGWSGIFKEANPFEELVTVSSPFFWLFLALVGIGLIVLRQTDAQRSRPVRAWGYPVTPLIFIGSSLFMCYSSVNYAVFVKQYLVSGGIIVAIFLVAVLFGATGFHRSPPTKSATNQIN